MKQQANMMHEMKDKLTQATNQLVALMAAFGDAHFDPGWTLLKLPVYGSVHGEHLAHGMMRHPVRESLYYALVLLERGGEGDVGRSQAMLHKVISLQDTGDPENPRFGLWHYYAEEKVADWQIPDFNWADFNGMTLLMIWHLHCDRLDKPTRILVREAISRAASCIRRRNVTMLYTNIAIKGTFVTLAAAELLEDHDLMRYATDRARRLHQEIFKTSCVSEYNSPTYAGISIAGLMAIDNFVRDEPARKLCREIQHQFWMHIARHYHVPTRELAGPHSRSYTIRLNDAPHLLGTILMKATGGAIDFHFSRTAQKGSFDTFYGCFLEPDLPSEARALLVNERRTETVVEIADLRDTIYAWWRPVASPDARDGSAPVATPLSAKITTYLNPDFTLGSVNLMDGWEQRQNLIGYWKNGQDEVGYLRHRYMHDERPCCSGYFASVQREGTVLAASFLAQYCDHHVSIPAEEISAEFLGTVIDINNGSETFDLWLGNNLLPPQTTSAWLPDECLWLRLPTLWIALRLLAHEARPASDNAPKLSFNGSRLEARLPHYQGARKTLRWTDLDLTHTSYLLWMSAPQEDWERWRKDVRAQGASVQKHPDGIEVKSGEMRMVVPARTLPRECLSDTVSFPSNHLKEGKA